MFAPSCGGAFRRARVAEIIGIAKGGHPAVSPALIRGER